MHTIPMQLYAFFMVFLAGIVVGFFYDLVIFLSLGFNKNRFVRGFLDFGFWVSSAAFIFSVLFNANNGQTRYYIIVGIILGIIVYRLGIRRHVVKMFLFLRHLLKRVGYKGKRAARSLSRGTRLIKARFQRRKEVKTDE